jgi:hypothetical protein
VPGGPVRNLENSVLSADIVSFAASLEALALLGESIPFSFSCARLKLEEDPECLGPASVRNLLARGGDTILIREGVFFTPLPLLGRLKSGSVFVKGGLGGPFASPPLACLNAASFPPFSLPKSVGSGVYGDTRALTTFSLLPTASLLCAFENDG